MGVNSLPKTVTRQRRGCDLNPGPSAPESSTLTTRLWLYTPLPPSPLLGRLCAICCFIFYWPGPPTNIKETAKRHTPLHESVSCCTHISSRSRVENRQFISVSPSRISSVTFAILDLMEVYLHHPGKVGLIGSFYRRAQFGWNWFNGFGNINVVIFCT